MRCPLLLQPSLTLFCLPICRACFPLQRLEKRPSAWEKEQGCGAGDSVAKGSQEKTQDWEAVLCSLGGSPSSTWDHRCPPSWKPCPGCSSLPHGSNIRFSLCPVLHPSSLPWSPALELHGEEAGGPCPSRYLPCSGPKACANLPHPLGQGWGHFPGGVASAKPWEWLWCLGKMKTVLPRLRKLRGIRIPGVLVLHPS